MENFKTRQLVLTGLAAAFICITGPMTILLPLSPVPISLCTLSIYLFSYLLGSKHATISVLVYLLIGFFGLPVFAGFTSGPGHLLGPTGGYLIGYILIALICGHFRSKSGLHLALGCVLGTLSCYALGTLWLALQNNLSLTIACSVGILPFLPGDIIKILCIILIGPTIQRRLRS